MKFFTIASGSSGNCAFVGSGETGVLIDAGVSRRRIEEGLTMHGIDPEGISAILLTHEHSDHIGGLGVFLRRYQVPVYGTPETLKYILGGRNLGVMPREVFKPLDPDCPFEIGGLNVEAFSTIHDAANPVGYRFADDSASMAVVTDLGSFNEYPLKHLSLVNALILESNHDEYLLENGIYPYPPKARIRSDRGHLSNASAGDLLCRIYHENLRAVMLGHLSEENNVPSIARNTVQNKIRQEFGRDVVEQLPLTVASRTQVSEMIEL